MAPFIIQVLLTPEGYIATGFVAGGCDYETFIAKMKWGSEGHWSYNNRFTGEITQPAPIYHFYLFLGHLAGWIGIKLPWMYHLVRSFLAAFSFVYLYKFLRKHVPVNPFIALILTVFASGGYLSVLDDVFNTGFNSGNTDLFLQGRVWLAYICYPHYCLEFLGVLLLLDSYLSARSWMALTGGIIISLVHPFLLGLFCPVILISSVFRKDYKQALMSCSFASLGSLPILIPLSQAIKEVEWLKIWRNQTRLTVLPFWNYYILGYGLTGIAGWYGFVKWVTSGDRKKNMYLWAAWMVVAMLLSYTAPLPNKREYAFFFSVPIGIFAAPWIEKGICFFKKSTSKLCQLAGPVLVMIVCIWQSIAVYSEALISYTPTTISGCSYISPEYQQVFKIIEADGADRVVLSEYWYGNMVPVFTKSRPYVGHLCETQNFKEKKQISEDFLIGRLGKAQMEEVLKNNKITWIVLNKDTMKDSTLVQKLWTPVFNGQEVILWKVNKEWF